MFESNRNPFRSLIIASGVFSLAFASASGQIEVFNDPDRISEEAVLLEHRNFRTGSVANGATSLFGVAFYGEGGAPAQAFTMVLAATFGGALTESGVRNESIADSALGGALIVDFRRPLLRLGFNLGNGSEGSEKGVVRKGQ